MKDGGITRGIILERIPGKSIKIQIGYKEIVSIPLEEIEKISREKVESNISPFAYYPKSKGYSGQLDIGFDRCLSHPDLNRLHVNLMNGYRFNSFFTAGLGLGLRYYKKPGDILVPVFGSLKLNLLKKRLSPFLMISAGYSFDSSNEDEKIKFVGVGKMANPSIGFNIILRNRSFFSLGIGYEWQEFNLKNATASYFSPLVSRTAPEMTRAISYMISFGF
jgi:hypothetical protein